MYASERDSGGDLLDSCCLGMAGCRAMVLVTIITSCKKFQAYDKTETEKDSHARNESEKFSRTASIFMRALVKHINV